MKTEPTRGSRQRRGATVAAWAARAILFSVLVVSGLFKLNDPYPAAEYVRALTDIDQPSLLRLLGFFEVVLAVCLLVKTRATWAPRVALVLFIAFVTAHSFAVAQPEPLPPCGCMGTSSLALQIPEWVWIPGNSALALLAWIAGRGGEDVCVTARGLDPLTLHGGRLDA